MIKRLLPWLAPAALAAVVEPFAGGDGGDSWLFVRAGRTMLSTHWSHAFADQSVQVGPLQLALYGSVGRSLGVLAVLLAVAAAVLVMTAARAAGVERPQLLALTGLAAVACGFTTHVFDAGHPANGLLPLLWIVAGVEAHRGRTVRAALLVGLSAGLETWGILGLAVLALAPTVREAGRSAFLAVGIAGALYVPFVVTGHFAMGGYRWDITSGSVLGQILTPGGQFGWPLRVAQGGAALAVGIFVAHVARRSPHAFWLVPMTVVAVRLLLDPQDHGYYFDGMQATAIVGLALVAANLRLPRPRLVRQPLT